ncbi:sodium- and chloride-dependent neutral and basic amino acid transporter B(0+)-like [Watersipora subatra]|uniref:sodium- and chloride-dependent neutral and basic amino acid transporter B(0+)-like n=1 Tax=Watersipora subatra TaxID=2589382 RepID=UPI00355AFE25
MSAKDEEKGRGTWSSRVDFILSCLGYTVGLGNVWRFPYLAYFYGGVIFLIPYAFALLLIGMPMFFLELSLGQFTSSGPLTCWRMAPIAQGIGAAMLVVSSVLAVYYNMIIAWALHYLIASFSALPSLPWRYCNRKWATIFCADYIWKNISESPQNCSKAVGYDSPTASYIPFHNGLCIGMLKEETNSSWFIESDKSSEESFIYEGGYRAWADTETSEEAFHPSILKHHAYPIAGSNFTTGLVGFWNDSLAAEYGYVRKGAAAEYFIRQVLRNHLSTGMADLGTLHWDLALPLFVAWFFVFVSLIKGIQSSGKVVYFTAIFPYILLLTLLIRGALMDGSLEGILYYIIRNSGRLLLLKVWKSAAEQTFFSLSTCYGGLITLASYNNFNNNVLRDTVILTLGDTCTSFFSGFVIFSFLGALAKNLGVRVSEVTDSGIALAFVVYPEAVTHIQPEPLWAVLFFIMLLTLGLDSEFGLMETILTAILDIIPRLRSYKTGVIGVLCVFFYLVGLSMCTSGGLYVLVLLDTFGAGWNVLLIAVLECLTIAWLYSIAPLSVKTKGESPLRFVDDIQLMIGTHKFCYLPWKMLKWFWLFMWALVTPILCLMLMIGSLVEYGSKPALQQGDYIYERGFIILGWFITVLVLTVILFGALAALGNHNCSLTKARQPTRLWGPALEVHKHLEKRLSRITRAMDGENEQLAPSEEAISETPTHKSLSKMSVSKKSLSRKAHSSSPRRGLSVNEVAIDDDSDNMPKSLQPKHSDIKREKSQQSRKSASRHSNLGGTKRPKRGNKMKRRETTSGNLE